MSSRLHKLEETMLGLAGLFVILQSCVLVAWSCRVAKRYEDAAEKAAKEAEAELVYYYTDEGKTVFVPFEKPERYTWDS